MKNEKPDFPWWLVALTSLGLWLFYAVWANQIYADVLRTLAKGIWITIAVTLVAYGSACVMGLGLALAGLSRFQVLRQLARGRQGLIQARWGAVPTTHTNTVHGATVTATSSNNAIAYGNDKQ